MKTLLNKHFVIHLTKIGLTSKSKQNMYILIKQNTIVVTASKTLREQAARHSVPV